MRSVNLYNASQCSEYPCGSLYDFVTDRLKHGGLALDAQLPDSEFFHRGYDGHRFLNGSHDGTALLGMESAAAAAEEEAHAWTKRGEDWAACLLDVLTQLADYERLLEVNEREKRKLRSNASAEHAPSSLPSPPSPPPPPLHGNPIAVLLDCVEEGCTVGRPAFLCSYFAFASCMSKAVEVVALRESYASMSAKKRQAKKISEKQKEFANPKYKFSLSMLASLGWTLLVQGRTRSAVKVGLSLLSVLPPGRVDPNFYDAVMMIGACEEFTFYSGRVLFQTLEYPEEALVSLAQCVHGWGRVILLNLIAQIEPLSKATRAWMLAEGFVNALSVHFAAYSVCVAADPLQLLEDAMHKADKKKRPASEFVQMDVLLGIAQILVALSQSAGRPEGTYGWDKLNKVQSVAGKMPEHAEEDALSTADRARQKNAGSSAAASSSTDTLISGLTLVSDPKQQQQKEEGAEEEEEEEEENADPQDEEDDEENVEEYSYADALAYAFLACVEHVVTVDQRAQVVVPEGGIDVDLELQKREPSTSREQWLAMAAHVCRSQIVHQNSAPSAV
eukprot:ANDGO_00894.mRNA.1 hypothetical protein